MAIKEKIFYKQVFVLFFIVLFFYLGNVIGTITRVDIADDSDFTFSGNPAAVYCAEVMGYEYHTKTDADGSQDGYCILPDQTECEQWDFYAGTCGAEYSYCIQEGYDLETMDDGQDPFSSRYATCVVKDGQLAGTALQPSSLFDLMPNSEMDLDVSDASLPPNDLMTADAVPTSWDWRSYNGANWLTSVRNQASCGGCWSFAALGVTEAYYNIIYSNPNLDKDLSEQELISCSSAGTCSGGWTENAFAYIRDVGVSDEFCIPYTASDSSCNKCGDWASRLTSVNNYSAFVPDQTLIKNAIVTYGPVYASMGWDYGGYFDGDIYRCTEDNGTPSSNHAIVIVGYNDAGGYWLVKNSWGTGFEDGGYFKVGYNECYIDRRYAGYVYNIDDNYEQNDTLSAAYTGFSERTWLSTVDGDGIQADEDWYEIYVTSGYEEVLVDASFTHSAGDIDIALYNASGSLLASSTSTTDDEYIDYVVPTGGAYYYIKVYYDNAGNSYDLWWDDVIPPPPPPGNDDFDNAISISPTNTINLDTRGATQNADDPHVPACNMNAGKATVWYKYSSTTDTAISLDTKTSDYDTFIAIWTGTRTNLSPVVCNDDIDLANGIRQSEIIFRAQANVTYYIEVGQWDGYYGDGLEPELIFTGTEDYETDSGAYTSYLLQVNNWADYPSGLFDAAPDLPPCGSNYNSSRTWVRIYANTGEYLYGFCALSEPADLQSLGFSLPKGEAPPSSVYIVINDRLYDVEFISNLADIYAVSSSSVISQKKNIENTSPPVEIRPSK